MRLLIDTNIFLEALLEQEKAEEAKSLLSNIENYEFYISDFSLHSIGVLLFYKNQYDIFEQFIIDMIYNAGIILKSLNIEDMKIVINSAKNFDLDFDDAYQYGVAEKYNLIIVSFDKDFDRTEKGRKTSAELL